MAKRILIAEDEPNIVTSLEFLLGRAGYELRIARDGDEALAGMLEFGPDLVLLDVMMPRKNGFEVCQKIRENPDLRHIKVVMLTAKGRDTEVSKGLGLGADAYVSKPFSTKELMTLVQDLLARPDERQG